MAAPLLIFLDAIISSDKLSTQFAWLASIVAIFIPAILSIRYHFLRRKHFVRREKELNSLFATLNPKYSSRSINWKAGKCGGWIELRMPYTQVQDIRVLDAQEDT